MMLSSKFSKLTIFFLIVIIVLGIYIRFSHFNEESYWGDDMTTIPTALLWFYPHSYYPGLAGQGEPALGNYFIGLGCMASGQDFSKVTEIQPMFYPGRPALIGKEMIKAESYCHLPMYIFGLFFFIAAVLLAFLLLDEYSALYASAFFAFSSFTLQLSRWIHVDTLAYVFVALGLVFLWKFYAREIGSKHETLFLILSSLSFGFAVSTKLPAGIFTIFIAFIVLKKYKIHVLSIIKKIALKLNLNFGNRISYDENPSRLIKLSVYSLLSYSLAIFVSFEFKFSNLLAVIQKYQQVNPEHSFIALNRQFLLDIYNFLVTLNSIDIIIAAFSIYIFIKLVFTKKTKNEEFVFYLFSLFLLTLVLFSAMNYTRVLYLFIPAIIFMMALAFSDANYSIFSFFKISSKKTVFFIFLALYIASSFYIANASSPHFTPRNQLLCTFSTKECSPSTMRYFCDPYGLSAKYIANDLSKILNGNETFVSSSEMVYYYIRQEESYDFYLFINSVRKQISRRPNLDEFLKYYKPENRTLRYVVANHDAADSDFPEFEDLKKSYQPYSIVKAYGMDVAYIYDMENLRKK